MRRSRLSQDTQERLIEHFIFRSTVNTAAENVGVHRNTAAYYFHRLRQLISDAVEEETQVLGGIDCDGSDDSTGHKDRAGRDAHAEVVVFWLLYPSKMVYTAVIPKSHFTALMQSIKKKIFPGSIVYTDFLDNYQELEMEDFEDFRPNIGYISARDKKRYLEMIADFWDNAKRHLLKFYGIPRTHLGLYLKEYEWRYNHPYPEDQLALLKKIVKDRMGSRSKTGEQERR
jgi:transposase